jgi:Arrestin (or S-antigen), N-terminal domain
MVYNLRIHVDPQVQGTQTQPRLFIPGDRVSGKVVLTQQEDEKIENIFIELKGKWKTKIVHHGGQNNTQTHRYELDFYTERQTLFKGPFKMRASSYEYLFAFQIPEKFNYVAGEFSDGNFAPEYSFMGPKPLPPTCMGPYDRNGECEIYYHLTARIPKTFSDWEDKYVLNFSPPRTQPDLVPLLKEANEYNA